MATANLSNSKKLVLDGKDNVVIVNHIDGIRGGRSLDVDGFAHEVIHAGHLVVKLASGDYAPMPLTAGGDAYAALPSGATYAGYLVASIPTSQPIAGIMTRGTINPKASPFALNGIINDVKEALPLIDYQED